ncbi:MAG: hypothetical protein JXB05_07025 [Myxococcaceae bacterium]|nr:hypothetical protein [Myxococcaceae bacterium]
MRRSPLVPRLLISTLSASLWLGGCGGASLDESAPVSQDGSAYAEQVYEAYEEAATGQVDFEVKALQAGAVRDIAERPVNELLGVPSQWIQMDQRGTEITSVRQELRVPALDEWASPVWLSGFEQLGRSLDGATYRLLAVSVALDAASSEHRALEICWVDEGSCIVMDPVVQQLDAFFQNRRRLQAEGWAPVEQLVQVERPAGPSALAGTCSLNSNPASTRRTLTYGGYTVEYKNVFGITLVGKTVGRQEMGISCYVAGDGSCRSSGFGFSNSSSCWANLGYTCDCENTGNMVGNSPDGAATKSWSETRCAHQLILNAAVSFTYEGTGASFNINWQTAGSVDTNGGQLYDSCSWH